MRASQDQLRVGTEARMSTPPPYPPSRPDRNSASWRSGLPRSRAPLSPSDAAPAGVSARG